MHTHTYAHYYHTHTTSVFNPLHPLPFINFCTTTATFSGGSHKTATGAAQVHTKSENLWEGDSLQTSSTLPPPPPHPPNTHNLFSISYIHYHSVTLALLTQTICWRSDKSMGVAQVPPGSYQAWEGFRGWRSAGSPIYFLLAYIVQQWWILWGFNSTGLD